MTEERENYCKLLGLNPLKMDSISDRDIDARIRAAEEKWNRDIMSSNTSKRLKYLYGEYIKLLPDIRTTMDNSVLRKEEFEKAKVILESKASKIRRNAVILHDGSVCVPQKAAEDLCEKLKWEGIDGRALIIASGIENRQPEKPTDLATASAFRRMSDLGAYSPHQLLNDLIGIQDLNLTFSRVNENCPLDDLRVYYDTVSRRLANMKPGKFPNEEAYIEVVRAVKSAINSDEQYDKLIRYAHCMKVLEPAFEQMEEDSGTQFTRAYIDGIITTYINGTEADINMCILALEEFCVKRNFPANFSERDSELGQCPNCKAMIDLGTKCKFCPSCGSAINEICPICGMAQTSANKNCIGCGTELYSALRGEKEFQNNIKRLIVTGDLDQALAQTSVLESEYPYSSALVGLKEEIRADIDRIAEISEQIASDFAAGNYYGIKKTVDSAKIEFPAITEKDDIHARYEEAVDKISQADALCVKAAGLGDEEAKELYIQASEACPDHPSAIAMLTKYPPEGPGDVMFQVNGDTVEMKYEIPEDNKGMTYCIYRTEGTYPEVDQYTKPLAETEQCVYFDRTAEPGVEYYYKIYSKRWGVLSQEYSEFGPALVICEVTDVDIKPVEDGLKITYQLPRGATRVRIWRKEANLVAHVGDEDEVIHDNTGTVVDNEVEGGTEYNYLFVAEYDSKSGNTARSLGNYFSAMTAALPQPISDLSVVWDRRNSCYRAKWSGHKEAVLYYTTSKEAEPGAHMSMKDISMAMDRIEPIATEDGSFCFDLPRSTVLYIYPTIEVGNAVVVGKAFIIANLRPFWNLSKTVDGSTCRISMDWPEDAEYVIAEITGKDGQGRDRKEEMELSRGDYNEAGYIEFNLGGSSLTDVCLYAEYTVDGSRMRSVGVTTKVFSGDYSKVTYTVETESVKGDRKKTRVVISFSCPEESIIPRCVMVRSDSGIPLRSNDGEVVWESDDPVVLVDGTTVCNFVISREAAKIEHMRLFFPDRSNYNKYRFVHPLYNRRK